MSSIVDQADGIAVETTRQILAADLKAWKERRHALIIQSRVRKTIGWSDEALAPFVVELEQVERAIEILETELVELPAPA